MHKGVFSWSVIRTEGKLLLNDRPRSGSGHKNTDCQIRAGIRTPLEGLLKHRVPYPSPRLSDSVGHGWAQEPALLTRSQVMVMLLVWGLHFKNHWPSGKRQGLGLTEHRTEIPALASQVTLGRHLFSLSLIYKTKRSDTSHVKLQWGLYELIYVRSSFQPLSIQQTLNKR